MPRKIASIRRLVVQVHKWVGIAIGLVVLMWLVTGLVMIQSGGPGLPSVATDLATAIITPAQAAALAVAPDDSGAATGVRRIALHSLGRRLLYQVYPRSGGTVLIDASDGTKVTVSEELVREVAADYWGERVEVTELTRVVRHDAAYPFGPLPVFRAAVGENGGMLLHVAERDATVRASSARGRVVAAFGRWHTFRALQGIYPSKLLEHGLLWFTSLLGIGLGISGYLISFKWRRRRLSESQT